MHLKKRDAAILLWISFLCANCTFSTQGDQPKHGSESLYQTLSRTVVRLEQVFYDSDEQSEIRRPMGTGFFVQYKQVLYLVTARHLAASGQALGARVPAQRKARQAIEVIELRVPAQAWVMHPTEQRELETDGRGGSKSGVVRPVDVAVTGLPWPQAYQLAPLIYCPSVCSNGPNQLADLDPEPPEEILVFGYPRFLGLEFIHQRPLARIGIVAMAAKEPFIRYRRDDAYADARMLVVDVRAFEGNSGSPVFRKAGFNARRTLVGIIAAGADALELTYAEPVSRIKETIEWAHAHKPSEQAEWLLPGD